MLGRLIKKLDKKINGHLLGRKMSQRLLLSYFVPTAVVGIILAAIFVPYVQKQYRTKMDQTVKQSLDQSDSLIEQYINDMYYIEELMEEDSDINDVLKKSDLELSMDDDDAFRQYWKIMTAIQTMEAADYRFRISIYLPDPVLSLPHKYYFHPLSELRDLDPEGEFYADLMDGRTIFREMEDYMEGSSTNTSKFICLMRKYECMEDDYTTRNYIFRIEIDKDEFLEALDNASSIENSFAYLLDDDGKILAGTGPAAEYTDISESSLPQNITANWKLVEFEGKKYYALRTEIRGTKMKLMLMIPRKEYGYQTSLMAGVLVILILAIEIIVFFISRKLSLYYGKRLSLLNRQLKAVEDGNLTASLEVPGEKASEDEIDEIYGSFNQMTGEIRQLMKEEYRLGKEVTRSELKVLQAQINPHFLYNTLDLINWGAMDYGAVEVARIARDLGIFYRMSLNHGKSVISIRNELKHVQAYVNIENVHFDGKVHLQVNVPEDLMECGCLNIILQPFVENSILHGMAEHPEIESCEVTISAFQEEDDLVFCISDNGPGIEPQQIPYILQSEGSDHSHGYGVKNINFRIQLCFGEKYGVHYKSFLGHGTDVYVRLPKRSCEELEEMI